MVQKNLIVGVILTSKTISILYSFNGISVKVRMSKFFESFLETLIWLCEFFFLILVFVIILYKLGVCEIYFKTKNLPSGNAIWVYV